VLRWAQWRRLPPHIEVTVSFMGTYLAFFVANAFLKASGAPELELSSSVTLLQGWSGAVGFWSGIIIRARG
jgi:hypothetical protein